MPEVKARKGKKGMPKNKKRTFDSEEEEEEDYVPSKRELREEEEEEEEEEGEEEVKAKRSSKKLKRTEEGFVFDLSRTRRITVREFRGKTLVDIREFYTDNSGELRPGKKGISLPLEQWKELKKLSTDIDAAVKEFNN
eukprot:Nk52_evm67s210 gene=Nk52_evmTU67s210